MAKTILCETCHRVIWDTDAVLVDGKLYCVDCAPLVEPEEEKNGNAVSD